MNPQDIFTATVMLAAGFGIAAGILMAVVRVLFIVIDEIERMT